MSFYLGTTKGKFKANGKDEAICDVCGEKTELIARSKTKYKKTCSPKCLAAKRAEVARNNHLKHPTKFNFKLS